MVRDELTVNGLISDRASHLLDQITSNNFNSQMDFDIQDTPWEDFKKQANMHRNKILNL